MDWPYFLLIILQELRPLKTFDSSANNNVSYFYNRQLEVR